MVEKKFPPLQTTMTTIPCYINFGVNHDELGAKQALFPPGTSIVYQSLSGKLFKFLTQCPKIWSTQMTQPKRVFFQF